MLGYRGFSPFAHLSLYFAGFFASVEKPLAPRVLNHLILCHQVLLKMKNVMYQTVQPMVVAMKSHHILLILVEMDLKSTGYNARI
jgi:hypothetical protein